MEVHLCFELGRATVVVNENQLSLAIGKRGQNVRLAAKLTGWDIDILTPNEFNVGLQNLIETLRKVPGVDDPTIDKVVALGIVSPLDLDEVGIEPLVKEIQIEPELAEAMVTAAVETSKRMAAESEARKAAEALATGEAKVTTEQKPGEQSPAEEKVEAAAEGEEKASEEEASADEVSADQPKQEE
jgi:N utilization substance protein A